MKHLLNSAIFILLPAVAYAENGDYQLYDCKTYSSALACDSSCSKFDNTVSFKVNVDKDLVIANNFEAGKLTSSYRLNNCSVVNNNNWECKTTYSGSKTYITTLYEMHDEIYSYVQSGSEENLKMFRCGRKINLLKKLFR